VPRGAADGAGGGRTGGTAQSLVTGEH